MQPTQEYNGTMINTLTPEQQEAEEQRIEQEISELNGIIDGWEDIDPIYMHREIRELRHRVMFVHTRCESSVGLLLGKYVLAPARGTIEKTTSQIMMTHFDNVVSETDFARKVTMAYKFGLIERTLKGKLFDVNNLRLIFSHPKSHDAEIKEFLDRKNYLEALKKLKAAYDEFNDLFRKIEEAAKEKTGI